MDSYRLFALVKRKRYIEPVAQRGLAIPRLSSIGFDVTEAKPSPKEFLKARRPERFSDSSSETVTETDRSMLEYHLDTLTSRSQETEFEHFARALIKLEICPNLLPQTGPTGGGDSKVDSETYPVADELALTWYVGVGSKAASERWAFAFSAKKKWQPKLKSDVAKIAGTGRGYAKAFFVTNQYVRDRARGELEDELRKAHKLDVRILDRKWILDAVFDHGREELAIQKLGISPTIRRQVRQGPLDLQREAELSRLESRIEESALTHDVSFVTVDDCIDAAVISRELERPNTETLGRFDRAENMAARYGTQHQRVRCAYDRAWTVFFWFEDIPRFAELYGVVEDHAKDSQNVYDLELLTNLWMLLHGHAQELSDYEKRTEVLFARLTSIAENEEAPTAALQARAFLTTIAMARATSGERVAARLQEFSEIIQESEKLPGFPFLPLADTLIAVGEFLGSVPEFDTLHDQLVEVVARRKGEVEGARLILHRAEEQLHSDRPIDTIRSIGKALHRLAKDESRSEFARALYVCGCAYERIGLLWAARGTLLMAASVSVSDYWNYEDVTPAQAICLRRLKWIELQLGRLPHLLSWHEVDSVIRGILIAQGYDESSLLEGSREFDVILGLLLLKADFWKLKNLVRLPDLLRSMGLASASIALLHALGHEQEFLPESLGDLEEQDRTSLFVKWRDQPAGNDLAQAPELCDQAKLTLHSSVLGCSLDVKMPNEPPFLELGESLVAAIEATLATAIARTLFAREPNLTVEIRRSDFCAEPFEYEIEDDTGSVALVLRCRCFDPDAMSPDQQIAFKERFAEVVAYTVGYIVIPDMKRVEELFRDDAAIARAIDFTGSFQVLGNVLGKDRKRHTSCWATEDNQEYRVQRAREWDAEYPSASQPPESFELEKPATPRRAEAKFTERMQTARHSQFKTYSLIRESLWNKAGWRGLGFVSAPDSTPILAIIFTERDPARQIFKLWEQELGKIDETESLRICIVQNIDRTHPFHYRVVLGSDINRVRLRTDTAAFAVTQRIHTCTPASGTNLDTFLTAYRDAGAYYVAPAVATADEQYPEPIGDFYILKRELIVRQAWEVGCNDPDSSGILPGDKPAIPGRVSDAPVTGLLKVKRARMAEAKFHETSIKKRIPSLTSRREKRKDDKRKRQQKRKSQKRR